MYKDPRQDSSRQRNISYTKYPKKCFTQIYRDLYGDAMLVSTWMSTSRQYKTRQNNALFGVLYSPMYIDIGVRAGGARGAAQWLPSA